jgi:hypothetical protein
MTAREPKKTENGAADRKPARRKLRLSKETVKDLTDPKGGVKGGQQNTDRISCTCAGYGC